MGFDGRGADLFAGVLVDFPINWSASGIPAAVFDDLGDIFSPCGQVEKRKLGCEFRNESERVLFWVLEG